jgi:hypothetical protein
MARDNFNSQDFNHYQLLTYIYITYKILTYRVTATQLTTFVPLYSYNNITLMMAAIEAYTYWLKQCE